MSISEQKSLTREQKEAVGLLSIGTFLEYFDLMLYVHMAVLLNELFFPKTDSFSSSIIAAFTFCVTFITRPLGALLFGWIGDNIGRKSTVIITTFMMAFTCFIMANLPTYAQWGYFASIFMIICRILQGMSSLGETVGAELYLTETIKPPLQYPIVSFITVCCSLGGMVALIVAHISSSYAMNWRVAFWFGAGIALIGGISRTALKETPEFVDAKRKLQRFYKQYKNEQINLDISKNSNLIINEKVDYKTCLALFLMDCMWPFCFYFSYIYCGSILSNVFGYTPEQIIYQNFTVSIVQLAGILCLTYLSYIIHPLKILRVTMVILFIFLCFVPYLLNHLESAFDLFIIQSFIMFFILSPVPAMPIIYRHFPVFKRFTYVSFIFALSRAVIYLVTSFGLIFLNALFGYYGMLIVVIPGIIGFGFGLLHFTRLDQRAVEV